MTRGKKTKAEDVALSSKTRKKHLPNKYKPPNVDKIKKKKELNILPPREYIFVAEYVKDWNMQRAFFAAYPSRNKATAHSIGHRLLKKPRIIKAVQMMQKKIAKSHDISREFILDEALDTYYCSKQAIPVRDREGNPIGVYKADYNCSIKCLELISKICGFIQNKVLMSGSIDHNIDQRSTVLVKVDELPLTFEQKKELLMMIQKKEEQMLDGEKLSMNTSSGMPKGIENVTSESE